MISAARHLAIRNALDRRTPEGHPYTTLECLKPSAAGRLDRVRPAGHQLSEPRLPSAEVLFFRDNGRDCSPDFPWQDLPDEICREGSIADRIRTLTFLIAYMNIALSARDENRLHAV